MYTREKEFLLFKVMLFVSFLCGIAYSKKCEAGTMLGSCKEAKTAKAQKQATHLCFTIRNGKKLLVEIKTLRQVDRKITQLLSKKSDEYKKLYQWSKLQLDSAEKAVKATSAANAKLTVSLTSLEKERRKLVLKTSELEGRQWKMLVIGFSVGVAVTGIAVGALVIAKSL